MANSQLTGQQIESLHILQSSGLRLAAARNGAVHSIEASGIQINQVLGSSLSGGLQRIFLRVHDAGEIRSHEIMGPNALNCFEAREQQLLWSGAVAGLKHCCAARIHPAGDTWVFSVEVENTGRRAATCDVVMLQDIALATRAQVRNNELFTSQYIDHFAGRDSGVGYVVMSRQNLPQTNGSHPWLMQGCVPRTVGFTTDGLDFFGSQYKGGSSPAALSQKIIGEAVRQYEMAYIAIQGASLEISPSGSQRWDFFFHFVPDHPEASSRDDLARMKTVRANLAEMRLDHEEAAATPVRSPLQACELFQADELAKAEIAQLWPGDARHREVVDGRVWSFFHRDDARHVVLAAKELNSPRPHGHILRAGKGLRPDSEVMSCTFYAAGVFASQLAMGNTSLALMLSRVRDPLNILRSSGMRIFAREENTDHWQLLGVPSAFEMAMDECRWIYKRGKQLITVRCRASEVDPAMTFDATVDGAAIEFLISAEIAAGPAEFEAKPVIEIGQHVEIRPNPDSMLAGKQPGIRWCIVTPDRKTVESIRADSGGSHIFIQTRPANSFTWTALGAMNEKQATALCRKYAGELEPQSPPVFWKKMTAGVRLECPVSKECQKIQDVLTWFARDAVVHLGTPRGLEQASGGAWGVRDVCQGPVEFLLSYGHTSTVADILRVLFSQQYEWRWDWPQWFMFAPFESIQSPHCHGDVLVWPLKALCDYLEESNDPAILREELPYTNGETFARTSRLESVLQHVDRLIEKMQTEFVPGLSLPRYGEGDWDDSLQPADAALRSRMVSSWTTELMIEQLLRYAEAMKRFGEEARAEIAGRLASAIDADFQRYLLPGGVVAGFAVFDEGTMAPAEYLLHPSDTRTGLHYRLIPMTRGIISGIFSSDQAIQHLALIEKHLLYPDGARLMDRPTSYHGGIEQTFRRSESAAFFGREIGLQYVHAHLRYAQALARMGKADELLRALMVVNPIAVTDLVPGARPRQRNCYFSSSDAAFPDRYEASRNYEKLRDGSIPTDGGWRVYSSGPGIYTNLVIRHLLGLRRHYDCYEFDPVIPAELNGATCEMTLDTRRIRFEFSTGPGHSGPQAIIVNGRELTETRRVPHPYRLGGLRVKCSVFNALLKSAENIVRIEL